ncbi:MAG: ATP synthase F1 subunit gamma [Alkaliphilus sp.]|nr:ATP synthase F1 subunit gamma [bacterium AH-315-L21]MBN4062579.1 ATP synthase F1 subunit gamma [Alkaliphilus sp. AH-315-G20]MBN4074583.1 ATP synthase F1 subunit gamma [bacterium AH-315-E09]PHS35368.1 MAG: ATP synthase F1 subunit gamma [Alkaliphilus sp.]
MLAGRDIKRRIKSVTSTKQITKAMELVSSAKLRKAKKHLQDTKPYFTAMHNAINEILDSSGEIKNIFLNSREVKKTLYIVIAADRGLCGGYNANVLKKAANEIAGQKNISVLTVGQKARDFFRKMDADFDGEYIGISERPTFENAKTIGALCRELFKQNSVDEVILISTEFVSTISHKPRALKILPLTIDMENYVPKEREERMEYEPSAEEVFDYLVPKYIDSMIYGALIESSTSEQGARRVAMESATDNAEEMIDKLKLKYNRARQASITQEIAEIVGGAEALK